jgi:hypothetical protein
MSAERSKVAQIGVGANTPGLRRQRSIGFGRTPPDPNDKLEFLEITCKQRNASSLLALHGLQVYNLKIRKWEPLQW